jgi:hypothetical protein
VNFPLATFSETDGCSFNTISLTLFSLWVSIISYPYLFYYYHFPETATDGVYTYIILTGSVILYNFVGCDEVGFARYAFVFVTVVGLLSTLIGLL